MVLKSCARINEYANKFNRSKRQNEMKMTGITHFH